MDDSPLLLLCRRLFPMGLGPAWSILVCVTTTEQDLLLRQDTALCDPEHARWSRCTRFIARIRTCTIYSHWPSWLQAVRQQFCPPGPLACMDPGAGRAPVSPLQYLSVRIDSLLGGG